MSLPAHKVARSSDAVRRQRTTLIALLIASFMALLAIIIYEGWLGYHDTMSAARSNALNLATVMHTRLDASLRRADSNMAELTEGLPDWALNQDSAAYFGDSVDRNIDAHLGNFPELDSLRIFDANGDILYTSDRKNSQGMKVDDRSYFRDARDGAPGQLVFSDVIVDRVSGRPTLILARALRDHRGEFRGVVAAALDLDYFDKLFAAQDTGPHGNITLLRGDTSNIITRWPPVAATAINQPLPLGSRAREVFDSRPKRGVVEIPGPTDGVVRIFAFQFLENYPFLISVGLASSDVLADWRKRSVGIGLSVVVLFAVLAFLLRRLWNSDMRHDRVLAALAESEERARLVLDSSMDAAIGMNGEGYVTEWSAGASAMFGYPHELAQGSLLSHLIVPPRFRDAHAAGLKRFLETGKGPVIGKRTETIAMRADGSEFPIELSITHIGRDGENFFSAFVRDTTNLKEAETERAALESSLRQSQKMEAIGKLTGGMAHDFNNYLGVIIGNLDLLSDHLRGDAEATKLLNGAMSGAERSAELTRSLLAFSRNQPLAPKRIDVSRSLQGVAVLLQRALGDDIALTTDLRPDLWPVCVDDAQLDSCIVNLANNARDAMPRGGTVTVSARNHPLDELYTSMNMDPDLAPGDYVLIEIADTGIGMPPEAVSHAFEPFYSTKPVGHGTGLGLSMVQGFVKQSHGHISLYSEVDRGTVVRIYLPRDRADDNAQAGPDEPAPGPAMPRGSERILVVDDNAAMRQAVVAQLISLGYRTIEAPDGVTALAILEKMDERLDLMLTDIVMPGGLDGFGLERMARMRRPDIKVLLTSGFPDRLPHVNQTAASSDLLRKPYRLDLLARTIRTKLDASAALARAG